MNQNSQDLNKQYFEYLKTRSALGDLYRKFFLYPRISKHLHGRTLDIGCGIGDMLRHHPNCIGADINPYNVDYCLSMGSQAFLFKDDTLPVEDASFDSALLDNVLEHIEQPKNILAEIRRVLKPNGRLIVGVPGIKGFESDSDHKLPYDEEALVRIAEDANYKINGFFYTPLFKSPLLSRILRQYCIYSVWGKA